MKEFHWRDREFDELRACADEMKGRPGMSLFVEFCRLREQGLRRQAMDAVRAFIQEARSWPLEERKSFVDMLMHHASSPGSNMLRPQPLIGGLILPTLHEWIEACPGEAAPRRWLGILSHDSAALQKATEIDPGEQIARGVLIDFLTGDVEYAVHELPWGYLGDPVKDLATLEQAQTVVAGLTDPRYHKFYAAEIQALRETVQSYLDYRNGGAQDSFADWAAANGRRPRHIDPVHE